MSWRSGALDAHHARFAARTLRRVGLHHGVVLLVHPTLGADVRTGQQLLQVRRIVARLVKLGKNFGRRIQRNRGLPCAHGPVIQRRIVGKRLVGNVGHQHAVVTNAQPRLGLHRAADDCVQSPLGEDLQHFVLAAFLGHQQHALLAFREHNLVRAHAGFALRNQIELDVEAHAAARAHLTGRAGEAGRAHVLNADDCAGLHGLQAGFQQQLLHKGVAHLHVGALGLSAFVELLAGHGRAVNAVAARLGSHINHRVAAAGGLAVKNFVLAYQAESEGVHQRIAGVAGLELGFAAQVGHAKAIAVSGNAADHTFHHGVIFLHQLGLYAIIFNEPKAQRVHHRQRTRTHGKDVAQNAAHAGGRALVGLNIAGVVVALDLEGAGPAVAYIDNAGVLARPLHHALALGRQALQVHAAGLVGAMLAPHDAVNAQFGE